ncbi:MAG: MFS transporter [Opitutaceae bacterium]|nr:MFS transporter [Opitutaceae bacterium]
MNPAGALAQPRWRILAFLCFAAMLNYADRAAFSTVLPPLREELGLSDVAIGLMGSLFLWSYALACPVAGIMADRYSRSRLVVLSLAAWSLVTLLTGLTNGLAMLAVLRIGLGISESLYLPAAIALLADHHGPKTRGRALALHSIGLNFGVVAGGAFAGYLAEHFGWRTGFWVLGGAGVLLAAFGHRFFDRTEPPAPAAAANRPGVGEVLRYLVRVPTFHALLLKMMLSGFTIWIFLNWLPLYFREAFHLSLGAAGFAGTFMLQIAFVVGLAAGGWISDVVSDGHPRRRMLMLAWCYLLAAPFLLLFLTEPGFGAVVVAISAFSLLRGMGDSCEKPALCEVVPPRYRSTAIGLMNACANANGGIGVFLIGLMKGTMGLNAMFACLSGCLLLAAGVSWVGYRFFMQRDMQRLREHEAAAHA